MTSNKIILRMEGNDADNGHLRLSTFAKKVDQLGDLLSKFSTSDTSYFRVVDLSHNSPATLTVEEVFTSNEPTESAVDAFVDVVSSINDGSVPQNISFSLLNKLNKFGNKFDEEIAEITVSTEQKVVSLLPSYTQVIKAELERDEFCFGVVEGLLEQINVHANANKFTIYPEVGASKVLCQFPKELVEMGIDAVRRRVRLTGLLKYRRGDMFASEIKVDELEILPLEKDLPKFWDLNGIAPDLTKGTSSETFVRGLRDEWEN